MTESTVVVHRGERTGWQFARCTKCDWNVHGPVADAIDVAARVHVCGQGVAPIRVGAFWAGGSEAELAFVRAWRRLGRSYVRVRVRYPERAELGLVFERSVAPGSSAASREWRAATTEFSGDHGHWQNWRWRRRQDDPPPRVPRGALREWLMVAESVTGRR